MVFSPSGVKALHLQIGRSAHPAGITTRNTFGNADAELAVIFFPSGKIPVASGNPEGHGREFKNGLSAVGRFEGFIQQFGAVPFSVARQKGIVVWLTQLRKAKFFCIGNKFLNFRLQPGKQGLLAGVGKKCFQFCQSYFAAYGFQYFPFAGIGYQKADMAEFHVVVTGGYLLYGITKRAAVQIQKQKISFSQTDLPERGKRPKKKECGDESAFQTGTIEKLFLWVLRGQHHPYFQFFANGHHISQVLDG